MKIVLLFILVAIGTNAFAASTKEECAPMKRIEVGPIRDQGDIGWCYANAAADLMSFEYRHQLQGKQTSAIYTALTFTDSFIADLPFIGQSFADGGSAYFSLKAYAARHNKVCLQTADEKLQNQGLKISLSKKLKELMLLKSTFDDFAKNRKKHKAFTDQWWKLKKADSYLFTISDKELFHLLAYSSARDFPHNVADALCSTNSETKTIEQKSDVGGMLTLMNPFLKNKAVKDIHSQLSQGNIVGLAYRASVLTDPEVKAELKSAHLSVLVGRRWDDRTNKCEFLIRNSWGKGCSAYKDSPVFKQRCDGDGYVWIPESIMKKAMIGISYYDKTPTVVSKAATAIIKAGSNFGGASK